MRYGQSLQLEFCGTGPRWRLSGGSKVDDNVARRVIANPEVVGDGDALFPQATPLRDALTWLKHGGDYCDSHTEMMARD